MYTNNIMAVAPRVISQIDRDCHSMTYGDCDRNHWHLKTRDFSSAILQQTGLSAFLLYDLCFNGNQFYKKKVVKAWAQATVTYWQKIQLNDGSFNEYYPHEHGFPPTAFSLFSACEVYRRSGMNDSTITSALSLTGRYLCRHSETKACNQEIASITALYSLYEILNEKWILDGIKTKLEKVLSNQSPEGWFSEYGGADIGYNSVSLDFLAEYYWKSKDPSVLEPLNRLVSFLKYFVHPDGTVGGEYASRNTTYFMPNGLEVMAQFGNQDAIAMRRILFDDQYKVNHFLEGVDDRYWSHYILHSFLRALEKNILNDQPQTNHSYKLPFQSNVQKNFEHAGIFIQGNGSQYVIVGTRKGGVIKFFNNDHEVFFDCGWRIHKKRNVTMATNWLDPSYVIDVNDQKLEIKGQFNQIKQKVSTPLLHLGLRFASLLFGNKIISLLKRKIILVDHHSDVSFSRNITLTKDGLELHDCIHSPEYVHLVSSDNYSLRHVASGNFFSISDLSSHFNSDYHFKDDLDIHRTVILNGNDVILNERFENGT